MMLGKKIKKVTQIIIKIFIQLNLSSLMSIKRADIQKNIIEYFVRSPNPTVTAQQSSQKSDSLRIALIKKKVEDDQNINNQASVVAN